MRSRPLTTELLSSSAVHRSSSGEQDADGRQARAAQQVRSGSYAISVKCAAGRRHIIARLGHSLYLPANERTITVTPALCTEQGRG